jgi:hypothetical protein
MCKCYGRDRTTMSPQSEPAASHPSSRLAERKREAVAKKALDR